MPTKRKQPNPGKGPSVKRKVSGSARHASIGNRGGFSTTPVRKQAKSNSFGNNGFDSKSGVPFSRRSLLIGAGAIAGVAAVGGVGSYVAKSNSSSNSDFDILSVASDRVTNLADLSEVSSSDYVSVVGNFKLPYGTLCWVDNDTVGACLEPGSGASPLNTVSLLYLSSGSNLTVLDAAYNASEGFEILDVRCSEEGMIWTEANLFKQQWRIMTGVLSNARISSIQQVDQGDSNWVTPSIAASGSKAFWQVCPVTDGECANERSVLKYSTFGSSDVGVAWSSKRPFATRVQCVADGVVITPRADSTSVYYQLTKISNSDVQMQDQITLPASMKPCEATYLASGFAWGFEDIYSYGNGISNLGIYTPMVAANPYNYSNINWFRFGRTPTAAPAWCGDWFISKSTRGLVGIHFAKKYYFSIDILDNTDDYGEYLISSGVGDYFAGLSQIKSTNSTDSDYALVRVYTTIDANSPGSAFA